MDGSPFPGDDAGSAFNVTTAVREAVPALIALWGFSDSGKTYSALRLARGLVGPAGKIVLIDTENRRAKFYAGLFGGWSHIDMQPPFTPARYTAAYNAAIKAGANVVIVDSQSHVWEGEGGVLDQADANDSKGLAKWKAPKTAYKRMTNALFRAPVHMIFCIRAKEKFVQQKNAKGRDEIVSVGNVPICDSRFVFEMTVALQMESGSRKPLAPIKAPDGIAHAFVPGQFISEDCGAALAAWLAEGTAVDHEALALQAAAREAATKGTAHLREWWGASVTKGARKKLEPIIAELQATADEADQEATAARRLVDDANAGDDPLSDPFTKTGAAAPSLAAGANQEDDADAPTADPAVAPGPLPKLPPVDPKASLAEIRKWFAQQVKPMVEVLTSESALFRLLDDPVLAGLATVAPRTADDIRTAINSRVDMLQAGR